MKVALVTDTHFGARSDSLAFDSYFSKFYTDTFFPEIEKRGIKTIVHLGDVFDRRKYINYNTLKSCKEYFFDKARDMDLDIHMIPGNHDTYFKNTNDVNSPELLLQEYNNITIYPEVTELMLDRRKVLFMPWICGENYQRSMEAVKDTDAEVCFGHFEFAGFIMYKGFANEHGMDAQAFNKFDLVCSGHFHHRHKIGNVAYLGNPYEMTWSDFDDPRGFNIYDTVTNELEFIENPNTLFRKFYYDDESVQFNELLENIDYKQLEGRAIKLIVVKKTDFNKFDNFVDKLYSVNPYELKILEDFSEFEDDAVGEEAINLEDTMSLLNDYVDNIETDVDKDKLKTILQTLYIESQNTE
jgi:DNA repair exonuclease SbcCD nuclease subunit